MGNFLNAVNKRRRENGEDEIKSSSSQSNYKFGQKAKAEELRLDTLEADLNSLGTTISDIYSGWQNADTMTNARTSVENMKNRLTDYQAIRGAYGWADLSGVLKAYEEVLGGWDERSSYYGQYQNADAFNKAVQKLQFDEQFEGLTFDGVQEALKKYEEGSAEHEYLSNYTNYTDLNEFDKALASLTEEEVKKPSIAPVSNYLKGTSDSAPSNSYAAALSAPKTEKEEYSYRKELEMARNKWALDNTFDYYKHYMDAEDFEEKSQYVSTKSDDFWDKLVNFGYEDKEYEYINNVDGARDKIDMINEDDPEHNHGSRYKQKGYDKLYPEEIAVYNALYAEDKKNNTNKADKFLEDMEITLSKRVYDESTTALKDTIDNSGPGMSAFLSALSVPANLIGGVVSFAGNTSDKIRGKEYNPYSRENMLSNIAADTRRYVDENIESDVWSFLYNTGMSMADSTVGALTMGKAFTPLLGMTSAQQKAKELTEAGAPKDEVFMTSLAAGIFEAGMEYVGVDNLFKIKDSDTLLKVFVNGLKQAGAEGLEEVGTEVLNTIADNWIRGDSSEYAKMYEELIARGYSEKEARSEIAKNFGSRVGQAFLGGALSGGTMGSVYSGYQFYGNAKTGKNLRSQGLAEDVLETAGMSPEGTKTRELYEGYKTANKLGNAKIGNLHNTMNRTAVSDAVEQGRKEGIEAVARRLSQLGYKGSDIMEVAEAIMSEKQTFKQKKLIEESGIAQDVLLELEEGKLQEQLKPSARLQDIQARNYRLGKINRGESVRDKKITERAEEIQKENADIDLNDALLQAHAETMDEAKKTLFMEQSKGVTDIDTYAASFNLVYEYGRTGFDEDTALRHRGTLTPQQTLAVYKAGIKHKVAERQQNIDNLVAKYAKDNKITAGNFDDSVIDYENKGRGVNWKGLTSAQRGAVAFTKALSKATGINITLIKSNINSKGEYEGETGSYNPDTNTIELDIFSGRIKVGDLEMAMISTLSHEITHWMKEKAPALYQEMTDIVMDSLTSSLDYTAGGRLSRTELIHREMKRIQKAHPDIDVTEEYAIDELVARACEDMLSNSKAAQELLEQLPENERKTLYEKFKEAIENLKQWIHELLGQYSAKSPEARILREYEDKLIALQDTWDKAFKAAVTANQALQKNDKEFSKDKNTQYQERNNSYYINDKDIVVIKKLPYSRKQIEQDFKSVKKLIENALLELNGQSVTIREDGKEVFFDKKTADEYAGSNDTAHSNAKEKRAKANATVAIKEIVERATNPLWVNNKKSKHKLDAKRGWTYYDVDFGMESSEGVTYYDGRLVIRMDKNDTDYVYDIINIKKKPGTQKPNASGTRPVSKNSVTDSTENVNKKTDIRQYTYGGRDAFNVDTESFTNALIMRNQGVSEEEVFEKTGWFLGTDKKWRFEIDDSEAEIFYRGDARLADNPLYKEYMELFDEIFNWGKYDKNKVERFRELDEIFKEIKKNRTVEDYMKHDMLFDAYPFLRYIGVERVKMRDEYLGAYKPSENVIKVNQKRFKENSSIMLKKILLHELQHVVQHFERFASGAHSGTWSDVEIKKNQWKYEKAMEKKDAVFAAGTDEFKVLIRKLNQLQIAKDFGEEYDKIERKLYEKFEEQYLEYDNALFEARLYRDSESLSDVLKYQMTAGEIEARDVENRADLNEEERKKKFPVRETENGVIFSENKENPFVYKELSYQDRVEYVDNVSDYMTSRNWADVRRVAYENKRGEADIINKARCGDFIIPSGSDLVYTKLNKRNPEDIEVHQIIHVDVQEDRDIEDTNHQFVFERFIKEYENGQYENTSIEEYGKFIRPYVKKMLGREVSITVYTRPDYQSNRKNGLARKEETGRRLNYHFGDEQDGGGDSTKGSRTPVSYQDRFDNEFFELFAEDNTVEKESKVLGDDLVRLADVIRMTGKKIYSDKLVSKVARYLCTEYNSDYDKETFSKEIAKIYEYIAGTEDLQWNDVMNVCYELAGKVLKEQRGKKIVNDYAKMILKDIRSTTIRLDKEQIEEAKSTYGSNYRFRLSSRVKIDPNGIALSRQWQQWAEQYPDIFDANITSGDQITALVDLYGDLREASETVQYFRDSDNQRQLALEIYNKFWTLQTEHIQGKYEMDIKKLKAEHRKAISNLKTEAAYAERWYDAEAKEKYGELVKEIRTKKDAEIQEIKTNSKKRMEEYKERVTKKTVLDRIVKNALQLNKRFKTNSKTSNIPEVMKPAVTQLLDSIDFSSKQLLGLRNTTMAYTPTKGDISLSRALEMVREEAQKFNTAEMTMEGIDTAYDGFVGFPPNFIADIEKLVKDANNIMRTVGDNQYILHEMSLEQLESLDKVVATIKHICSEINTMHSTRNKEKMNAVAQDTMLYLESMGERNTFGEQIKGFFTWTNLTPVYAFKRFGPGGEIIFEALQDAQDTMAFCAKEIMDYADKAYTAKEALAWQKEILEFEVLDRTTLEHKTVRMPVSHAMSLYCLSKRKQGLKHILGGGVRVEDFKEGVKKVSQVEGFTLGKPELDAICNALTDKQREVADKLQEFLNTRCSEWANKTSMLLYGIRGFTEKNYFPIRSDRNGLNTDGIQDNVNSIYKLLNMSFTKPLNLEARNTIMVRDIFDVFAEHTAGVAAYHSFGPAVLDACRWYNYKEKIEAKGEDATQHKDKSVKKLMETAYGMEAKKYVEKFLRDINGDTEKLGGMDRFAKYMMGNYKKAAVGANIRVSMLQPTAYVRAAVVIEPKYLLQGLRPNQGMKKAKEHCGIALWKSMGYYDVNISRGLKSKIKHDETKVDKAVEKSMELVGKMDEWTWGCLWNACEAEIKDKRPELKQDSDEYFKAISDRLREIIYKTQVVDSVMTRTQSMREKSFIAQTLTAFMSEPLTSYNMVLDAAWDAMAEKRRTGKTSRQTRHQITKVTMVYVISSAATAIAGSLMDAVRDDDEEKEFDEAYMEALIENFLSDVNPLGKLPVVKDIVSISQGYNPTRMDEQLYFSAVYAINAWKKLLEGKGSAYKSVYRTLQTFSQATGIPLSNLFRDVIATWNNTVGEIYTSLKFK